MSESDAAVDRYDNGEEDDCPLCLEPLPPFWDVNRRVMVMTTCCGKYICKNCWAGKGEYLDRAAAEGSYGRQEEQLDGTCPLCRTELPDGETMGIFMLEKYERGELPLTVYRALGLSFMHGRHGLQRDTARGIEILRLGAERGDPSCQYLLGGKYHEGEDLPKSTTEAKRWYLAATDQGHAIAEYELAVMLRAEGNDPAYLRFIRGSASKGYNEACYNLGRAYYEGKCGLQESTEEALRAVTPAAERGDTGCMGLLGRILCLPNSELMPKDNPNFTKGMHWLRQSAAKGEQIAISQLKKVEEWASNKCFVCNKEAPSENAFLRCSRCRAAWYCSKDCQRRHWTAEDGHKQFCIKWG